MTGGWPSNCWPIRVKEGPMPPDVLLFIEHAARELDVACILKCLLARHHGITLEMASLHYDLHRALCSRPPRAVAVPFFSFADDANLRRIVQAFPSSRLVNLAYEQLLGAGNASWKKPGDAIARNHVLHLASGDSFQDFLGRHGVAAERAPIVGSLPLALYRSPYRAAVDRRRDELARRHGLDADIPWIFFPENYSAAFLSDRELRDRVRRGFPAEQAVAYRDYAERSLTEVARWCYSASRAAVAEIILRPRPGVSFEKFRGFIERRLGPLPQDSLHLIRDATVREWNLAADIVVTSYSSTAVEAALADKPVYLLLPKPPPDCLRTEWLDYAPRIKTCEEFHALVRGPLSLCRDERLRAWAETNLLAAGDPLVHAAGWLARVAAGEGPAPPGGAPGYRKPSLGERLARRVKRGVSRRGRLHPRYETDRLQPRDLKERAETWAQVLDQGGVPA
jgi:hypothetical protein